MVICHRDVKELRSFQKTIMCCLLGNHFFAVLPSALLFSECCHTSLPSIVDSNSWPGLYGFMTPTSWRVYMCRHTCVCLLERAVSLGQRL